MRFVSRSRLPFDACFVKKKKNVFKALLYKCWFFCQTGCFEHPDKFAFKEGKDLSFQPKDDAFSVVALLQRLVADPAARMFPYHAAFSYGSPQPKMCWSERAKNFHGSGCFI